MADSPHEAVTLDGVDLHTAARDSDPYKRTFGIVERYLAGVERICGRDEQLHVILCVVPDFIYQNCRPLFHVKDSVGPKLSRRTRHARKRGQRDVFDSFDPRTYEYSIDFRRQIVRESTLRLGSGSAEFGLRSLTPLSDRAWNLTTTLFYKAGGKPWRLTTAREGVCYIGIAFRRQRRRARRGETHGRLVPG